MIRKFVPFLLAALALVWLANLSSQAQQFPSPKSPEFEAWRTTMKQTPLPDRGCFKASYPITEWQQVTCVAAPPYPLPPARGRRAKSNTVGGGLYDYVGVVSGVLSQAEGSFPTASSVASSNAYSLQLNTNTFHGGNGGTPACNGAAVPSNCSGWQQFVLQSSGSLYMEYWLLNWGVTCPSGWTKYVPPGTTEIDCYLNSSSPSIGGLSIADLPYISLTGNAAGRTDTALADTPNGDISAVGQDSVLDLEEGWNSAEFNVFGNGNSDEVNLNSGASLVVQINLVNGTTNTPTFSTESFTGETNNLTLIGTAPCSYGGGTPMIQFFESNASGATASCGSTGIETNIAKVPSDTAVETRYPPVGPPEYVEYAITFLDGTPGAEIHYVIDYCQQADNGTATPNKTFYLELTGSNMNCYLSGSMYATAPGYLTSPVAGFVD
jgi:hypothetical protein